MGKCPHCGSDNIRKRYREHRRYKWRCQSCNKVFRRPRRPIALWLGLVAVLAAIIGGAYAMQQGFTPDFKQDVVTPVRPLSPPGPPQTPVTLAVENVEAVATSTPESTPTARPSTTTVPTLTSLPTKTATPVPQASTALVATSQSVSKLAEFKNGEWVIRYEPQNAAAIVSIGWVSDGIDASETEAVQAFVNLAAFHSGLTTSLISLTWVADDITPTESDAIQYIKYLASDSDPTAREVVDLSWFEDGVTETEVAAIDSLAFIAQKNENISSILADMPWFVDGVTEIEAEQLKNLNYLLKDSEISALRVTGMSWFEDGVSETEVAAIGSLAFIARNNENIAPLVADMPWFVDGLTESEAEQLKYFNYLLKDSEVAALQVMEIIWFRDGVEEMEVKAVDRLGFAAQGSKQAAELVAGMDWFLDGVDEMEIEVINSLAYIAKANGDVAEIVAEIAWFADGIDAYEAKVLKDISYLIEDSEQTARYLVDMPWFLDGFTEIESEGIRYLQYLIKDSESASRYVVDRSWFHDGLTELEVEAIDNLAFLAQSDATVSTEVAQMSFLASIEPVDVFAIEALEGLAGEKPNELNRILEHHSLSGGITDELAPIISVLYDVAKANPPLVEKLMEPGAVSIERRSVMLPLAGEVDLAILRTSPGASSGMDRLEFSVRSAEELMGQPFPTRFVGLLYEKAVKGGYAGTNFGTHIAILPKYDIDDGSDRSETAFGNIAHEVAHYYWSGNADWIDEGLAELMTSAMGSARTGKPIRVLSGPCPYVRSIAELEALAADADEDPDEFGCNYSLGQRLFTDLYLTLGSDATWQRLRELYVASHASDDTSEAAATGADIGLVRQVFEPVPGASMPIARWYDGSVGYDLSRLDLGPVDSSLPSINGRINRAYITIGNGDTGVSSFSVSDAPDGEVWLRLEHSYKVSGRQSKQTLNVLSFYEDGFAFGDSFVEIEAESRYEGGIQSVWIGPNQVVPGRYWVYVYDGDRKVAEVRYEVLP